MVLTDTEISCDPLEVAVNSQSLARCDTSHTTGLVSPLSPLLYVKRETQLNIFNVGDNLMSAFYLLLFISMQFNAVLLLREADIKSIIEGSTVFASASILELLLICNPPLVMHWIPFWSNSFGRGVTCCILSIISLNGSFIVGIVALATSISITVSVVFTGSYHVPPPLMGDRSAAQDRLDARFNKEPAKSIYNSIQLQDY
jgi:hypothetical protein